MNILIYSYSYLPRLNGVTFRMKGIIDILKKNNKIYLITPDPETKDYEGIEVIQVPGMNIPDIFGGNKHKNNCVMNIHYYSKIYEVMQLLCIKKKIDIIHMTGPDICVGLFVTIGKLLNIPVISIYHTDIHQYLKNYYNNSPTMTNFVLNSTNFLLKLSLFNNLDSIICTSDNSKKKLYDYGLINNNNKVWIIPYYIDTEIFKIGKGKFKYKWKKDSIRLLYIGRVTKEKSIERILNCMTSNTSLVIIGEGSDLDNLKEISNKKNLNVNFMGKIEQKFLYEWYSSAHIFIMPSSTETLGFVTLEAMACKVPVIGYADGGTLSLIIDNTDGLLFKTTKELNDNIFKLINNKELRNNIINNAYEKVKKHSLTSSVNELYKYYEYEIEKKKIDKHITDSYIKTFYFYRFLLITYILQIGFYFISFYK